MDTGMLADSAAAGVVWPPWCRSRACALCAGRICVACCIDAVVTGFGAELLDMLLQWRYVGIFQTISFWALDWKTDTVQPVIICGISVG